MCNYSFRDLDASDLAVGALMCVLYELTPDSDICDFVPQFMLTASASTFAEDLRLFIRDHVKPRQRAPQVSRPNVVAAV